MSVTTEQTSPATQGRSGPAAVEPLTYRLGDLAKVLGVSRRAIEAERAAGRFPQPDLRIGRAPLWLRETIVAWIKAGGGKP